MAPRSTKLSWLHLTDLHLGTANGYLWPDVEERVFEDLEHLHSLTGDWSFVFFTGDMVQSGLSDEFREFEAFRARWMAALGALQDQPFWLGVPGNHDLVRPGTHSLAPLAAKSWLADQSLRDAFWSDPEHGLRVGVAEAFANWVSWWQDQQASIAARCTFTKGTAAWRLLGDL